MVEGVVLGSGIDLVENARMRELLARWDDRFKQRVFLEAECAYCESMADPGRHYAARFAVKESVAKAFGTGIGVHLGWCDIEVVRSSDTGKPSVRLSGSGAKMAAERKVDDVLISLSHTRHYAVAQALLVRHVFPGAEGPGA